MPVEIKEVVIRAVIQQDNEWHAKPERGAPPSSDASAIIKACVQEVVRIMKRSKER